MSLFKYVLIGIAIALGLTGCGAKNNSSLPNISAIHSPITKPSTSPAHLTFQIIVPITPKNADAHVRHALFISSATQSISIQQTTDATGSQSAGPSTVVTLTAGLNCTGSPLVCTISMTVPSGIVYYSVSLFSSTNGLGNLLGFGKASTTIVAGTNNLLAISIGGVVATTTATQVTPFIAGTASTSAITLTEKDAAGVTIIGEGPIANATTNGYTYQTGGQQTSLTASLTGPSMSAGSTSMTLTPTYPNGVAGCGSNFASSVSLCTADTTLSIAYNGLAAPPQTLTLSRPAIQGVTMTPVTTTITPALNAITASTSTISTMISGTTTVVISEPGWTTSSGGSTASPYGQTFTAASVNCGTIATATGGSVTSTGQTFTITGLSAGTCTFNFSENTTINTSPHNGSTVNVAVSIGAPASYIYAADVSQFLVDIFTPTGATATAIAGGAITQPTTFAANYSYGIAVDSANNVYISTGNEILIYTASGIAPSSIAGGAITGLSSPQGIAVDSSGNIYVANSGANNVLVFNPSGTPNTTINGNGIISGLSTPEGVAVDSAGNIYVANYGGNNVKIFTNTGAVSPIAGGAITGLTQPDAVAVDASGNIYVAGHLYIKVFASSGAISGTIPSIVTSTVPTGVAVDASGRVYAALGIGSNITVYAGGAANTSVKETIYTAGGTMAVAISPGSSPYDLANGSIFVGSAAPGGAAIYSSTGLLQMGFNVAPSGIAVDATGNIYVASSSFNTVRIYTSSGAIATSIAGGCICSGLSAPYGVAVDRSGNIYIANDGTANGDLTTNPAKNTIKIFTSSGAVATSIAGGTISGFTSPWGVALDSAENIYVTDTGANAVKIFTSAGTPATSLGVGGSITVANPRGIAVDLSGNIYAGSGNTVKIFTSTGTPSPIAGGTITTGSLSNPRGIAVDNAGNIYVANYGNNKVTVFSNSTTPGGALSTTIGSSGNIANTSAYGIAVR